MAETLDLSLKAIEANAVVLGKLQRGEKLTAGDYTNVLNCNYAMAIVGVQEENALVLAVALDVVADTIIELRSDGYIETFDESTSTYTVEANNGQE